MLYLTLVPRLTWVRTGRIIRGFYRVILPVRKILFVPAEGIYRPASEGIFPDDQFRAGHLDDFVGS